MLCLVLDRKLFYRKVMGKLKLYHILGLLFLILYCLFRMLLHFLGILWLVIVLSSFIRLVLLLPGCCLVLSNLLTRRQLVVFCRAGHLIHYFCVTCM